MFYPFVKIIQEFILLPLLKQTPTSKLDPWFPAQETQAEVNDVLVIRRPPGYTMWGSLRVWGEFNGFCWENSSQKRTHGIFPRNLGCFSELKIVPYQTDPRWRAEFSGNFMILSV